MSEITPQLSTGQNQTAAAPMARATVREGVVVSEDQSFVPGVGSALEGVRGHEDD